MILKKLSLESFPYIQSIQGVGSRIQSLNTLSQTGDSSLLELLPERGLGIVGTRLPQRRSIELVGKTIRDLAHTDLIIVSGFARGIDAYAHEFAIENGLRTIAILGCGIEVNYPKENQRLKSKIIDSGGLILSQFTDHSSPLAHQFHQRNALIAAFSKAVWVVEAGEASGTLNTATWTTNLGRDLYASSCFPGDPYFRGNQKLLSSLRPDRYPIAQSFFQAESFLNTWPELLFSGPAPRSKDCHSRSEIENWILEIKHEFGSCHPQMLMNYAQEKGRTLGSFYQNFQAAIQSGRITQYADGSVDVSA